MGHGLIVLFVSLAASLSTSVAVNAAPPPPSDKATAPKWIDLPDARLEMRGLPWLKENAPDLWRLPKRAQANVPKGVWNRAIAPDGGRIRLSCNTTALGIRVQALHEPGKNCFFDAFVDGEYAGSMSPEGTQRVDLVMFEHKDLAWKDVTIYLPHRHEVQVFALGLDPEAKLRAPVAFALKRPIVCYGSSVLQGTGALHPAHTYPAAAARRLNLDFVNLGFGGAGKGEVEVVALVNQLDACCYLFDLGKSYGAPTPERYTRMLDTIRASHTEVPIFCVTPIYSTKEPNEPDYKKRSEDLRSIMRQAATERRQAGDMLMFVVEGLELFGESDKALFHDPQHPSDAGNDLIASRLAPVLKKVVLAESNRVRGKLDAGTNAVPIRLP
jgi:lysophospholipase L1-like esterase